MYMKTVFISSTFSDMQTERDLLSTRVLPAVNAVAKEHGDCVSFSDLRWGIDTGGLDEERSGKKILNACLYEIDNCRPYMIVFLGERYGWRPGKDLLRHAVDTCPSFFLSDYGISATALEIEYGAFAHPDQFARTLFYFRAPSVGMPQEYAEKNDEARERLNALKKRIASRPDAHVYTYEIPWGRDTASAYDALSERITRDLCGLLSEDWKEAEGLSAFEREYRYALSYAKERAESFYSRSTKLALCDYLLDHMPFFLVRGTAGCGKTALLCKLIIERQKKGVHVLPVFCGLQPSGVDVFSIAEYILAFLSRECRVNFSARLPAWEDAEEYRAVISKAFSVCEGLPYKIEIFIDALGVADGRGIAAFSQMPFFADELPENVSFVIGEPFGEDFYGEENLSIPSVFPIKADIFDKGHIAMHMIRASRKELAPEVLAAIDRKSQNPLHLKWLLTRLNIMQRSDFERIAAEGGGMEAITAYQKALIDACPETLGDMGVFLARTACEYIGGEAAKMLLDYVCASRDGLSEESLRYLLMQKGISWSGLDFRLLMQFLDDFLFLRADGKCVLLHTHIKKAFAISRSLYEDLMQEILSHAEMNREDFLNYAYYAVCAKHSQAFLDIVLKNEEGWPWAARGMLCALRFGIPQKSYHDREDFMEKWMTDCLCCLEGKEKARAAFVRFFEEDYNEACADDVYYFRVMAFVLYGGDKRRVNAVNDRVKRAKKKVKVPFPEEYGKRFSEHCRAFEAQAALMAKKLPPRRERLIEPEERKGEILLEGRLFYLYFGGDTAFLMRDDEVLLAIEGYALRSFEFFYSKDNGCIELHHAMFDPHDGETLVETYTLSSPLARTVSYTLEREDVKGVRAFRIRFA